MRKRSSRGRTVLAGHRGPAHRAPFGGDYAGLASYSSPPPPFPGEGRGRGSKASSGYCFLVTGLKALSQNGSFRASGRTPVPSAASQWNCVVSPQRCLTPQHTLCEVPSLLGRTSHHPTRLSWGPLPNKLLPGPCPCCASFQRGWNQDNPRGSCGSHCRAGVRGPLSSPSWGRIAF